MPVDNSIKLCVSAARVTFGIALAAMAMNAQPTKLTVAEWRRDIAFVDSAIGSVHPAPFHRESRIHFDDAFARLNRDLPRLSDKQVATRLIGIVALLNDGHSRITAGAPIFSRDRVFPIRIERFADGIYVVATRTAERELLGARVLRMGALSAQTAWDSLEVVSSGDNTFSRMSNVPFLIANAELMNVLGIATSESLPLVVLGAQGDTVRRTLTAVKQPLNGAWMSDGQTGPGGATLSARGEGSDVRLVESNRQMPYWFAQRDRTLYVQINEVTDSRDSVMLGTARAVVTLAQFAQRVMERFDAGVADRLILDVRYNDGGNNALVRPFVNGVASRPLINTRGKFFVITGRATYSAAMNFVSMLEDRTEALFVGEPPGGAPQHYGDALPFILPNSKLTLRISTIHWTTGVPTNDVREVMESDIPAPPTFAAFKNGIDAPLQAVEAYREGSVLGDLLKGRYSAVGLDAAFATYDSIHVRTSESVPQDGPWTSDVQQLLDFAYGVIPMAKSRDDVFRAFTLVTDRYPQSHIAWTQRARVFAFVNDWPTVRASYERARSLRPNNAVIQRAYEAAKRR